ncbi:hypothetical protein L227DRAFT_333294 [Lentinus tigrinus ALCF2SS1-6]|uniref:Uncharacterized protein n=1 Tax=Lentinus tigrinus ALCF2SS1-6 TaxID=1328759 RepID=A0A5C2RUP9_9APHY|nr:hypothetical protein L227DRAFT_333294 [Lentinus tigrinus ALCF2SS1-6]
MRHSHGRRSAPGPVRSRLRTVSCCDFGAEVATSVHNASVDAPPRRDLEELRHASVQVPLALRSRSAPCIPRHCCSLFRCVTFSLATWILIPSLAEFIDHTRPQQLCASASVQGCVRYSTSQLALCDRRVNRTWLYSSRTGTERPRFVYSPSHRSERPMKMSTCEIIALSPWYLRERGYIHRCPRT